MRTPSTSPLFSLPLFSDLHSRMESLDVTLRVVANMRGVALKMGAPEVGFLGDWSHIRGVVPVQLQNAWVDEFDRWASAGLRLIVIPGNHDLVDVAGRHALECFRTHPAIRLYEKPTIDRHGLWIPYLSDLEAVRKVLDINRGKGRPVFWHGPMLGAKMNDFRAADRGLQLEDFRDYPIACLGHFHLRQQFGSHVFYIGSPWETRADEAGQAKGFAVLDHGALTYHQTTWGPQHRILKETSKDAALAQLSSASASDVVRISVPEDQVEATSRALAGRFADFTVTPIRADVSSARTVPGVALSMREHATRYVEEKKGDLREAELMAAYERFSS